MRRIEPSTELKTHEVEFMPTYEYACDKCGYRFEVFQPMTADKITDCPECDGSVKRLIGAGAGFIFKGPGFHATDYKKCSASPTCEAAGSCSAPDAPCAGKACGE